MNTEYNCTYDFILQTRVVLSIQSLGISPHLRSIRLISRIAQVEEEEEEEKEEEEEEEDDDEEESER